MTILRPQIPTQREQHFLDDWTKDEVHRFCVGERRRNCTFLELLDLWLWVPVCASCAASDPFLSHRGPDISGARWQEDVAFTVSPATLARIERLREDTDFAIRCGDCHGGLAPWDGDEIHVNSYHLEENFSIARDTPGRREPPARLRRAIFSLYGRACFGCGCNDRRLHIDHIRPQSRGGDAAFRNLQPLCEECGNLKGDQEPTVITVYNDILFAADPPDGHEGLFWDSDSDEA